MTTSLKTSGLRTLPMAGATLALSIAALLGGCVVRESYPPPRVYAPPPRAYAPPPPAYVEPAVEVEVRATEAPPPLPDYEQPPCPEDGYLWTPGYWAWGGGGYYWVPGTWVQPPRVGVLWTPGYWGFVGGVYAFNAGYWGPHVGYYGGVNYGFGYVGVGFAGGRWEGNSFAYNRTVNNVNVTNIHNTYNQTIVNNTTVNNVTVNKVSYNGGPGGTAAAPTAQERAAAAEPHVAPTPMQRQHTVEAARNPDLAAKANGGHPAIAATPRPAAFNAPGVVGAKGAPPLQSNGARFNSGGAQPGGQPNLNRGPVPGQPAGKPAVQPAGQQNANHAPVNPGQARQPNPAVRAQGASGSPGAPPSAGQARPPTPATHAQGAPGGPPGMKALPAQPPRPKAQEQRKRDGEHDK